MAFCNPFRTKIKSLLGKMDFFLASHLDLALSVTTKIRSLLASPVVGILESLIPSAIPELVRQKLLAALGVAITELTIAETCKTATTLEAKVICWMNSVKSQPKAVQNSLLVKLASLITAELHGNQLPQNVYDLFAQGKYSVTKTN